MEMSAARRWWILVVSMTAAITTTAAVNCTAFLLPQLIQGGLSPQRAGLFAAALLAADHPEIARSLEEFRQRQTDDVIAHDDPRQ